MRFVSLFLLSLVPGGLCVDLVCVHVFLVVDDALQWGTKKKFMEDPSAWWTDFWLRAHDTDEWERAEPNAGHIAIARIMQFAPPSPSLLLLPFSFTRWCPNRQFPNVRLATQNIDRLHLRAGCDPHRVAEVHGALGVYRCTKLFAFEFPFFSSHLSFLHESPEMCDLKQTNANKQNSSCKYSRTEQLEGVVLHRDEAGRVVPPRCPACGSLVMPMTLLFDEMYSSHVFFKNDVVSDWLDRAEVFVFAGTSLSVGITTAALHTVAAWNAEAFAMNVAPQHRRIPCSSGTPATLHDIVGPCEATLPLLAALCTTPSSPSLCSPSRSSFPLSCEIQ